MPRVGVPRLPSMAPPRAGTTYAYISWPVLVAKPNHLPGRPEDEPCVRGTIGELVGIQPTS
jgi:hypothetical protein